MKLLNIASVLLLASVIAVPALAQDISRPECVAPAKPGGGFDLTCRIAQQGLEKQLKTPMEVTFMPGGIGAVAINLFNTTRTDDPNAIVAFSSGSLLNMAIGKYGQWGAKDVRFLATAGTDYGAVIVKADSPYKTLDDLMAVVEKDPGSVVVGAGGSVGSQDWMKAAILLKSKNVDPRKMRYVAFDGGGDAIAGLLGGSIKVYFGDIGEMVSHLGTGEMRILAVLSDKRLPAPFAEVPTAKELGYDAEWPIVRGYYMGKNVSDEAYNKWVEAFKAAYATDAWAKLVKDKGLLPMDLSGKEMDADMKKRVERMTGIAKDAGLIQ
ncbi:tripartite tricarboxylate transporter substrate binding protein [Jiella sp. MQZ9-1]|uniref:Tripartite tricarboxylate transporter substrate binding protein n=1 Tax=Jiella flava TaxID=2816857 RepID=A0A939JV71_9HYPH|nr:tripartite tricarboxylate transporter substrate-binding protein [Jiella flava]MBO0662134.1 tripartite tricarboxylate transporter substrate binding protein [Jiella flava]MCD2470537.1 tripartite tricarboxylate transporter substrate binding protein [Jiella flava]